MLLFDTYISTVGVVCTVIASYFVSNMTGKQFVAILLHERHKYNPI